MQMTPRLRDGFSGPSSWGRWHQQHPFPSVLCTLQGVPSVLSACDVARTRPLPLGARATQVTQAKESAFSSIRSKLAPLGRALTWGDIPAPPPSAAMTGFGLVLRPQAFFSAPDAFLSRCFIPKGFATSGTRHLFSLSGFCFYLSEEN